MLFILKFLFPLISTYICNYYATPSRLFISDSGEILSKEGSIQGDPASMGAYAIGIFPILSLCLILF